MTIQEKKLTIEEFWELTQRSEYANKQLELVNGEAIIMSPSSRRNTKIALAVGALLRAYVLENNLGEVSGADGGYQIDEHTILSPDAGFFAASRLPEEDFVFYPGAPDIAVEVISPSETRPGILKKTRTYLEAGTRVAWNIYPDGQTVDVVTMGEFSQLTADTLTVDNVIDGAPALPGFESKASAFFT